ncbi:MAG TPA: hypothetical protein VK509_14055 [Polyangiales bacterium]|nr:hypothetical protein [Polyangiales bacterium]
MKCIHCQNDSKKKDRSDGRCPQCKRRFAFEPTGDDIVTDMLFLRAIERVSGDGRVRFHASHAYYEVRRRLRKQARRTTLISGVALFVLTTALGLLALGGAQLGPFAFFMVVAVVIGSVLFKSLRGPRAALPRTTFDAFWSRYVAAHGEPAALIKPSAPRVAQPLPEELLDYSFDRAVICDRPEAVDVLIANQFHFENNCAVLGVDGYPASAFATVRAMLRKNPRLLVLAIHDADPAGCRLAHRLRHDPSWFPAGARIVDVGLRPRHAKFFAGMQLTAQTAVEVGAGITGSEARWLHEHSLELAAVPPEQLIKRLFRVMTRAEAATDSDSGSSSSGDGSSGDWSSNDQHAAAGAAVSGQHGDHDAGSDFGVDADASDGGADSFG